MLSVRLEAIRLVQLLTTAPKHDAIDVCRWGKTTLAFRAPILHLFPSKVMTLKLSTLALLLGAGVSLPQIYGLARPAQFAAAARKLPRSLPMGYVLMTLGTIWFLWNVHIEPVADFAVYKPAMMAGFAAVGFLTCIFVRDFLAVRGLAIVLMLLAKLMLDTGRPHLGETPWVYVIQVWAYLLVIAGIWFTVTPWRFRDLVNLATATNARVRIGSAIRLAFAMFVMILGLTAFRAM
jgi:hypothetical protein